MLHRLILKVTKFHLPAPKRLGTVSEKKFFGGAFPCQIGLKDTLLLKLGEVGAILVRSGILSFIFCINYLSYVHLCKQFST